jgi:hypothetical protein
VKTVCNSKPLKGSEMPDNSAVVALGMRILTSIHFNFSLLLVSKVSKKSDKLIFMLPVFTSSRNNNKKININKKNLIEKSR